MNEQEIFNIIKTIIAERLALQPLTITMNSNFSDDLGADSLDKIEMLLIVERKFGIAITAGEEEKLITVGDAVNLICKKKGGKITNALENVLIKPKRTEDLYAKPVSELITIIEKQRAELTRLRKEKNK